MIEKDTHRVLLEILEGRGAETIQKGRNNERDRSSLKGYFSRNLGREKEGERRRRLTHRTRRILLSDRANNGVTHAPPPPCLK